MIAIQLEYTIQPDCVDDFRTYAQQFVELITKYGGAHHGYFIDTDAEKTTAIAFFTFADVACYDAYRKHALDDPQYLMAMDLAKRTRCVKYCHRTVYDRKIA
jgi:antibiotic biosynthesis monooxygenase (ABM) superfamily enzyme